MSWELKKKSILKPLHCLQAQKLGHPPHHLDLGLLDIPKIGILFFFLFYLVLKPFWECLIEMGRSSDQNWKNPIKFIF